MKIFLFLTIVLLTNQILIPSDIKSFVKNLSDTDLKKLISSGSLAGYWSVNEVYEFLNKLILHIDIFKISAISYGKSTQGREIDLYRISSSKENSANPSKFYINSTEKSSFIFMSNLHAREFASYHFSLYYITWLIRGYLNGDSNIIEIINNFDIYFFPLVNIDSIIEIQSEIEYNIFKHLNPFAIQNQKRKNGNKKFDIFGNFQPSKSEMFIGRGFGVDLNRNFDFLWGSDNLGSSPIPTDETFRGMFPFSEPETRAIRDVVKKIKTTSNIKFITDIHAYGNMFVIPDSPQIQTLNDFKKYYPSQYNQYMEIINKGNFSKDTIIGTGLETTGYTVNGDSIQYFFFKEGILSTAFELGSSNPKTETFFPTPDILVNDIIPNNISPIYYILKGFLYNLSIYKKNSYVRQLSIKEYEYAFNLEIINKGYVKYDSNKSKVYIYLTFNNIIPMKTGVIVLNNKKIQINQNTRNLKIIVDFSILPNSSIALDVNLVTLTNILKNTDIFTLKLESESLKVDNVLSGEKTLQYSYGNQYLNNDQIIFKAS